MYEWMAGAIMREQARPINQSRAYELLNNNNNKIDEQSIRNTQHVDVIQVNNWHG